MTPRPIAARRGAGARSSWPLLAACALSCAPPPSAAPDAASLAPDGSLLAPDASPSDAGPRRGDPDGGAPDAAAPADLDGRMWQRIELGFVGPMSSEEASDPNPFLDYRMNVTFVAPSGRVMVVPGFYAADGLGGDAGDVWKVRFTPDEEGGWSYRVSFERGASLAVADPATAGTPDGPDGESGALRIGAPAPDAEGFAARGRLEAVGGHYLRFRDGTYWLKSGTDSPENFLAYSGFDNTRSSRLHLHDYDGHVAHWAPGDPDWGDGRGRGIIGALNYLASVDVNSIYALLMNIGGDGQDVWPFAGTIDPAGSEANDDLHFDVGKLRQWDIVFEHAQRLGIALHLVLGEAEVANKRELDGGELGVERRLFYREMIARFAHHNALFWNLCEEYDLGFDLGAGRVRAFAAYVAATDPYAHPITAHNSRSLEAAFDGLRGDPNITLTSFQTHSSVVDGIAEHWRSRSAEAGVPWVISFDELTVDVGQATPWTPVYVPDDYRRLKAWPIYLSGGQLELILPEYLGTDLFTPYEQLWRETGHARRFVEEHLPFFEMEPADHLLRGEDVYSNGHPNGSMGGQVFTKAGELYAVYLPRATRTGELDLRDVDAVFELRWFNPRTGGFEGEPSSVSGGAWVPLGSPPSSPSEDWALLLTSRRSR